MIVKNKTLRVIKIKDVNLLPGMNEVPDALVKRFKKGFDLHVERRSIEMPKLEIEDDLDEGIGAYKANDAISLIEETHAEDKLKEYLEQEKAGKNRKSVVEALEKKIQEAKDAMTGEDEKGDLE